MYYRFCLIIVTGPPNGPVSFCWLSSVVVICRLSYVVVCKTPSTPATMLKQHCRMLQVEPFFRQSRMLLRHCCRFGISVAGFGNNVERSFVLSIKSKQIEHVQFTSTLSKGRHFVRHCCQDRQQNSLARTVMKAPKSCHITPILYAAFTISGSLNASNTSYSHLPTKFSQLPNLRTFITSSPLNVLAVLALHPSLLLLGNLHHPL